MSIKDNKSFGFTIVELLVVIVVIGILAAITIVSYSGIVNKALVASLQSDLDNNSKQLKLYNVEHGYYPNSLDDNNCPLTPMPDTRYCLKYSGDTVLVYVGGDQTFTLTATKSSKSYEITESLTPYNSTKIPVTAIAAITGTLQVSQILTAGVISPAGATVNYQWQSSTTAGGVYTNIPGATSSTYVVTPSLMGKYIKVIVVGVGDYSGAQTSSATNLAIATDSNWITVGAQFWTKTNLDVGTMITGTTDQSNNSILEKYCFSNSTSNCATLGGLYQWNEAMQYSTTEGARGICPAGSHVPSDNDLKILEIQLGMTQAQADAINWRGTTQGTQLKSGGGSGLNILYAGMFDHTAHTFIQLSSHGYITSSTESGAASWMRFVNTGYATVARTTYDKINAYPLRCVGN